MVRHMYACVYCHPPSRKMRRSSEATWAHSSPRPDSSSGAEVAVLVRQSDCAFGRGYHVGDTVGENHACQYAQKEEPKNPPEKHCGVNSKTMW